MYYYLLAKGAADDRGQISGSRILFRYPTGFFFVDMKRDFVLDVSQRERLSRPELMSRSEFIVDDRFFVKEDFNPLWYVTEEDFLQMKVLQDLQPEFEVIGAKVYIGDGANFVMLDRNLVNPPVEESDSKPHAWDIDYNSKNNCIIAITNGYGQTFYMHWKDGKMHKVDTEMLKTLYNRLDDLRFVFVSNTHKFDSLYKRYVKSRKISSDRVENVMSAVEQVIYINTNGDATVDSCKFGDVEFNWVFNGSCIPVLGAVMH